MSHSVYKSNDRFLKKGKNIISYIYHKNDNTFKLKEYIFSGQNKNMPCEISIPYTDSLNEIFYSFLDKIVLHNTEFLTFLEQQKLKKIMHSKTCKDRNCKYSFCKDTKIIYQHIRKCDNIFCNKIGCKSTKSLLEHHFYCIEKSQFCEVCTPILKDNYCLKNIL
jgi:hypothetical protein